MIVALGTAENASTASPRIPPAGMEPSPAPQPECAATLDPEIREFTVSATDEAGATARFRDQMRAEVGPDGRVGLVQLFGIAPEGLPQTAGVEVSRQLKELLIAEGLEQLPEPDLIRTFHGASDGRPRDVNVELFVIIVAC